MYRNAGERGLPDEIKEGVSEIVGPKLDSTHRPLSSSFLGLRYRILNINHKKELLRDLWVSIEIPRFLIFH